MYVLFIQLLFVVPEKNPPIVPVTRSKIEYYASKFACEEDTPRQIAKMKLDVPPDHLTTSYCVLITGPAGKDA